MNGIISTNAIFCERVDNNDGNISMHNMFNVVNLNEIDEEGFVVVVLASIIDEIACDLHIYLENHTEEEIKFKKIKKNSINNADKEIESMVQIFRFQSKKLISNVGQYYISVYKTERKEVDSDLESHNEIVRRENLISYSPLEVK